MILPFLLVLALVTMLGGALVIALLPSKRAEPKRLEADQPPPIPTQLEAVRQLSRRDEELEDDLFYIKQEVRNNEFKQRREAALKRLDAIKTGATPTP